MLVDFLLEQLEKGCVWCVMCDVHVWCVMCDVRVLCVWGVCGACDCVLCGVGLGHFKGPVVPEVQGCWAIISVVVGLLCVRELLLKAFLTMAPASGYAGARWASP